MSIFRVCILGLVLSIAGVAHAGGLSDSGYYCRTVDHANELVNYTDISALREEVERRYYHASDVSMAKSTIYSTSPLFVWANEAKISCAKALGYLKRKRIWRPEVNEEMVRKCECFHARMLRYSGSW